VSLTSVNTSISTAQRILEIIQGDAALYRLVQDNDPRLIGAPQFDKQNIVRTQLIAGMWRKIGRQVLAIHPEIVEETRLATSDKVPVEIMRVLPYMNPLVIYSDPPVFASWQDKKILKQTGEHSLRLLGFLTCGSAMVENSEGNVEHRLYATTSQDATYFTTLAVFDVLDEYGKVMTTEFSTWSFPFHVTDTLLGLVEDSMKRFAWTGTDTLESSNLDEVTQRRHRKYLKEVFSVIIGSLFYLCSTTLEAEQVPAKHVSKRIPKRIVRTPLSFYKIGWTTGGALSRYRQSRTNSTSQQSDISHQQDPQHRRSHFKMQPHGPDKALRKLIFVSAYWTHLERLGMGGVNTARRVPREVKNDAREALDTVLAMSALPVEVSS
jgi:hypothetical protein